MEAVTNEERSEKRPGPGAPPLYDEAMKRQSISMPTSYWVAASKAGNGNASAGLRKALAFYYTGEGDDISV